MRTREYEEPEDWESEQEPDEEEESEEEPEEEEVVYKRTVTKSAIMCGRRLNDVVKRTC